MLSDWRMAEEDLPDLVEQLNRGQSAEGVNLDGETIRWWVNPKENRSGMEGPPIKKAPVPLNETLLIKFATNCLVKAFSGAILEHEIPILAKSIANQWNTFDGFACIMTENEKMVLELKKRPNGSTNVQSSEEKCPVRSRLEGMGVPPSEVVEAIARLNLGQIYHCVGSDGNQFEVWQEPHKDQLAKRSIRPHKKSFGDPFVCPACGGVLGLWKPSDTQQKCNLCGNICQRGS